MNENTLKQLQEWFFRHSDRFTTGLGAVIAFAQGLNIDWHKVADKDPGEINKLFVALGIAAWGWLTNKKRTTTVIVEKEVVVVPPSEE